MSINKVRAVLCFECDNFADVLHHVVPVILGGKRAVPLCTFCHKKIHHDNIIGNLEKSQHSILVKEGLKRARDAGKILGRPKRSDFDIGLALNLRAQGLSIRKIAKLMGKSKTTVFEHSTVARRLKEAS